jgi:hypothetical protein
MYYWTFYNDGPNHPSANLPTSSYGEDQQSPPSSPRQPPQSLLTLVVIGEQVNQEALGMYCSQNRLSLLLPSSGNHVPTNYVSRRASFIKDIELWYFTMEMTLVDPQAYQRDELVGVTGHM